MFSVFFFFIYYVLAFYGFWGQYSVITMRISSSILRRKTPQLYLDGHLVQNVFIYL